MTSIYQMLEDEVSKLRAEIERLKADKIELAKHIDGCVRVSTEALAEIERLKREMRHLDDCLQGRASEIERLKAACNQMMIGGNHIATYRTNRWPDYGTEHHLVIEALGAGQEYDMWCCWNAIMCARDTLEP